MGLLNTYLHFRTKELAKNLLKMDTSEACQECDGKGFRIDAHSSEYFPFDNSTKCSVCNGGGFLFYL